MNKAVVLGVLVSLLAPVLVPAVTSEVKRGQGAPVSAQEAIPTSQLRQNADVLLATGDAVLIRRHIRRVWDLVDRLQREGRDDDVIKYLRRGLQCNSGAMEYQMLYAEKLVARGAPSEAAGKARLVAERAEDDRLVERAYTLLKKSPLSAIPKFAPAADTNGMLVLIPIGPVECRILFDLQAALRQALPMTVTVQDAGVRLPPFRRDPYVKAVAAFRAQLLGGLERDLKLKKYADTNGIKADDLKRDDVVLSTCRGMVLQEEGTNAVIEFDAYVEAMRQADKQWDMNELLATLEATVRPDAGGRVFFLGVMGVDGFADGGNYLFGLARDNAHHAIISYRRFAGAFWGEDPHRSRTVERAFKQSLSSLGFMWGVQRCTDPSCARAYPHSLDEHDAKSSQLCPECRSGFERATGRRLPEPPLKKP